MNITNVDAEEKKDHTLKNKDSNLHKTSFHEHFNVQAVAETDAESGEITFNGMSRMRLDEYRYPSK